MFIEFVKGINNFNSLILGWSNPLIEKLPVADFIKDALIDSINLVPFLFIIFFFIELFEIYFSKKIKNLSNHTKVSGPILGALTAIVPQCGFSVIASTLYVRRLITRGTLIAVYISTSDEAIPVLLAHPEMIKTITIPNTSNINIGDNPKTDLVNNIKCLFNLFKKIEIDCNIDLSKYNLTLLIDKVRESRFLRQFVKLSQLLRLYDNIINDKYKDFSYRLAQQEDSPKPYRAREYTDEELNSLFDNLEDIEL